LFPSRSSRFQGGGIAAIEQEGGSLETGNVSGFSVIDKKKRLRAVGVAAFERQPDRLAPRIAFGWVGDLAVVAKGPNRRVELIQALGRAGSHQRAPTPLQTFLKQWRQRPLEIAAFEMIEPELSHYSS
jgi:hypothetical protein